MRRLVLFRHAKAVAADYDAGDHQRPLSSRGAQDAPRMGRYLADERIRPDLALVSDAQRTRDTFKLAASAFPEPIPVQLDARIYDESESWTELLQLVRGACDTVETLMVVGHNPSIGELASHLSGAGDRRVRADIRSKFPTSGVAVVEFDIDRWSDVRAHGGRLDRFVTPGLLGGIDD